MKFTKEEISLCKQIAEKHWKSIKRGDWILRHDYPYLVYSAGGKFFEAGITLRHTDKHLYFPLWTISDCLEFIMERGLYLLGLEQSDDYEFSCGFCETDDIGMRLNLETAVWADGETPLEACLKAVLAVLEEK